MVKLRLTQEQLEALPAEISLAGFAITRTVYLNTVLLGDPENYPQYDWGYVGEPCKLLAQTVLRQYIDAEQAKQWANTFMHHIIAKLNNTPPVAADPNLTSEKMVELEVLKKKSLNTTGNFAVTIQLRDYLSQLVKNEMPELPEGLDRENTPEGWEFYHIYTQPFDIKQPQEKIIPMVEQYTELKDQATERGKNPLL